MNHVEDWGFHSCRFETLVSSQFQMSQWLAEELCFGDIDGHELENPILRYYADHHGSFGLIVYINQRNPAGFGSQHCAACFVEWFIRMNRDCLQRLNAYCFLDFYTSSQLNTLKIRNESISLTSQITEFELVQSIDSFRILPVVLNQVEII